MHASVGTRFIDIYSTNEHFNNDHKEMENVQFELVKAYPSVDLAVYKVINAIPLWKKCRNLFVDGNSNSPLHYLVNSMSAVPVILGNSVVPNSEKVDYTSYIATGKVVESRHFVHPPKTGYYTPCASSGLCGTVLCSSDGGVIGYHVAGYGETGFCVAPPQSIKDDIRKLMVDGEDCSFDLDPRVIPGMSGMRLRYEEPMNVNFVHGESSFTKTILHRDYCPQIAQLESNIFQHTGDKEVKHKVPPNFHAEGKPQNLLKKVAKKTFKHQGHLLEEELAFLEKCIDSMIPEFGDLNDDITAFGGDGIPALNKDSSNGYGCLKSKHDYFDFERKIIKQEGKDVIEEFRLAAEREDYSPRHFVSVESFKDELRVPEKADIPRTFRVMRMPHIW